VGAAFRGSNILGFGVFREIELSLYKVTGNVFKNRRLKLIGSLRRIKYLPSVLVKQIRINHDFHLQILISPPHI